MIAYRVDNRKYAVGDLISKHPESYYAKLPEIYLDNEKLLNAVSNSKVNRKDCPIVAFSFAQIFCFV